MFEIFFQFAIALEQNRQKGVKQKKCCIKYLETNLLKNTDVL